MSRIRLKKIIQRDKSTAAIIQQMINQIGEDIAIIDNKSKLLLGAEPAANMPFYTIKLEEILVGKVYGTEAVKPIVDLIQLLVNREQERRKLGTEVLGLYREVNLMYSFAEKLADTIDPESIAKLALEEVMGTIQGKKGFVTLQNLENEIILVAEVGTSIVTETTLRDTSNFFGQLITSKEPNIFNNQLINDQDLVSILFAPLNIKANYVGRIVLIDESGYQFTAADLKLLTTLSTQSAAAIENAQLYEKNIREAREKEAAIRALHEMTRRFVPSEFIKYLGYDQITEVSLGDSVEKEVTVFFSDIRGYTTLSEGMTPSETFRFVNAFNNRMGPIILDNNGFINQYLGDGIMAIFPFSPTDALNAAIEMHKELHKYNRERQLKNRLPIKIGIGLHTGPLIMGITGDEERLDATTISDTVNTAARIESLTKHYGVNILVSGGSFSKIQAASENQISDYQVRYLGKVQVKGKQKAIKIFECFDGDLPVIVTSKKETKEKFDSALLDFHDQRFSAAANSLEQIIQKSPSDKTAQIFLDKVEKLKTDGIKANWSGVELMTKK